MWRRLATEALLLAIILLSLAGCTSTPSSTTIEGHVFGQTLTPQEGDPSQTTTIAATVTCNGTTTQATSYGSFSLTVKPAKEYRCSVSADQYASQQLTIPGSAGSDIVLNFGGLQVTSCAAQQGSPSDVDCPALALLVLRPGAVMGMVRAQSNHQGIPRVEISCLPEGAPPDAKNALSTVTDSSGAFNLTAVPPGTYDCVTSGGGTSVAFQSLVVQPAQTSTPTFTLCDQHCPPVHYHGGPVIHTYTAYLIFWTPPHSPLDPGGSDAHFESTVAQFFKDVGDTPYFGLLSQYFDYAGYVQNSVKLGGVWIDTRPYQHCSYSLSCTPAAASRTDPLYDEDILAEVNAALSANSSWQPSVNSEFLVFTGYGAEECNSQGSSFCSFGRGKFGYCGFHGSFTQNFLDPLSPDNPPIIFAYIPNQANDGSSCAGSGYASPNGDDALDSAIDVVSHEMFESVSDPLSYDASSLPQIAPAWYEDGSHEGNGANTEIGDMCDRDFATAFGAIGSDGGNITLHGHRYRLQSEWSNRADACVFA